MPTFTIETPTGRKLDIEAGDQAAAIRGAQEWEASNPADTSIPGAVAHGAKSAVEGAKNTFNTYFGDGQAPASTPDAYQPAQVVKDGHVQFGEIPRAVAEQAPGAAAGITTAKTFAALARKLPGFWPKVFGGLGGAAAYGLMNAGNNAHEAATARTGDEATVPTAADKVRGAATTGAQAAADQFLLQRFLPGVGGKVTSSGLKGAGDAVINAGKTAAVGGASTAAQDLIGRVGAGSPLPSTDQLLSDTITGGATAGTLSAAGLPRHLSDAAQYRAITAELQPAANRVANMVTQEAGGRSLGVHAGYDAVARTEVRAQKALEAAAKGVTLSPEAESVVNAVKGGSKSITADDYAEVKNDPQATPELIDRLQDAHVTQVLKGTGKFDSGKFVGGTLPSIGKLPGLNGHGLVKLLLAEHLGSEIFHQSPEALAAMGGLAGAAFLRDMATGARYPAQRFVDRYGGDPAARGITVPPPPPRAPTSPTGPTLPPVQPWGLGPTPPATGLAKPPAGFAHLLRTAVMQQNAQARAAAAQAAQAPPVAPQAPMAPSAPPVAPVAPAAPPVAPAAPPVAPAAAPVAPVARVARQSIDPALRSMIATKTKLQGLFPEGPQRIKKAADGTVQQTAAKPTTQQRPTEQQQAPVQTTEATPQSLAEYPVSEFGHLPIDKMAAAIAERHEGTGRTFHISKDSFREGIKPILGQKDNIASTLAPMFPNVPVRGVLHQVASRSQARSLRAQMMQEAPEASKIISTMLSDKRIDQIWKK